MKKFLLWTVSAVFALYLIACGLFYFYQEQIFFQPYKLKKEHSFNYQNFTERTVRMHDGKELHGLLFKANSSKGLVFFVPGSAGGKLAEADKYAKSFTDSKYDIFILDYPGFGKSEGTVTGKDQLFGYIQTVYDDLKKDYPESRIIVSGLSFGTGLAAKLASANHPKLLVLTAPYYTFSDLMLHSPFRIFPPFLFKYNFETSNYLKGCKMPVAILHGDKDETVYYGSSLKLEKEFKSADTLITLHGLGHYGLLLTKQFKTEFGKLLTKH